MTKLGVFAGPASDLEHLRSVSRTGSHETVEPETATEEPNWSLATVSEPFNSPACFQPVAVFVNRHAPAVS
jgi:hypothetical protein